MNDSQLLRYSRHILLNEFDYEFQEKLNQSTALVIGCGGLANACVPILAGAGLGHMMLCDDDVVDLSNLPRQLTFTEQDLNQSKALTLSNYLKQRNSEITITCLEQRADAALLEQILQHQRPKINVIVDCSDNAKTRQLINRYAVQTQTPLVSASVIQFSGQVVLFDSRHTDSPCYACMYPNLFSEDKSCTQNGVFSPLVHLIGSAQAAETIKVLTGLGHSSIGKVTQFEGLNFETYQFQLSKNLDCPICGNSAQI